MNLLSLNQAKTGESIRLDFIPDTLKANLIRMGFCTGDWVKCIAKIPEGPVVINKGLQEIAIGNNYAREIKISK
jgi:Fe2+ transport system protein FeoA